MAKYTDINANRVEINKTALQSLTADAYAMARDAASREMAIIQSWSNDFTEKSHAARNLVEYADKLARSSEIMHALECFSDGREELVINLSK
jgi:hypothetical protein